MEKTASMVTISTLCLLCNGKIDKTDGNYFECDGICGRICHISCIKRPTRSTKDDKGSSTCPVCADLKPCHVLRAVDVIGDSLEKISSAVVSIGEQNSFLIDKVRHITENSQQLPDIYDNIQTLSNKFDLILTNCDNVHEAVKFSAEKADISARKLSSLSDCVSDLYSSCIDNSPTSLGPVFGSLKDSIDSLKNDMRSCVSSIMESSNRLKKLMDSARSADSVRIFNAISPVASVDKASGSNLPTISCAPSPLATSPREQVTSAKDIQNLDPPPISSVSAPSAYISDNMTPILLDPNSSLSVGNKKGVHTQHKPPRRRRRAPGTSSENRYNAVSLQPPRPTSLAEAGPSNPSSQTVASTLRPARRPCCIFVSRIHPETTEEEIVHHISSRVGTSRDVLACRKLNSRRSSSGGRSFTASFKVFAPQDLFSAIVSPDIWPADSIVREFTSRASKACSRIVPGSKNSSASSLSTTPM